MLSIAISASVCMSVRSHTWKIVRPNFTKFSVHVTWRRDSVLLWRQCSVLACVLPVLWMTSCFQIMKRMGQNGPESKTVRQVKSTVSDCILFQRLSQLRRHSCQTRCMQVCRQSSVTAFRQLNALGPLYLLYLLSIAHVLSRLNQFA